MALKFAVDLVRDSNEFVPRLFGPSLNFQQGLRSVAVIVRSYPKEADQCHFISALEKLVQMAQNEHEVLRGGAPQGAGQWSRADEMGAFCP